MIRFSGVSRRFGAVEALIDVDLALPERRIGVIGANGCGKSTFARMINGLQKPDRGTVTVDGLDTVADAAAVRGRVGFVFQNPDNQIVYPIVEEDLAFGLKNLRLPKAEIAERVTEALGRFGLSDKRTARVHELSGGQKQLLAIAGVVSMRPAHIVFDEPTTLLDLSNRKLIARTIEGLDQKVVLVTHDLDLLDDFDRVVLIDRGRVAADGRPAEVVRAYVEAMA